MDMSQGELFNIMDVPNIKIDFVENDKIVYSIYIDSVVYYAFSFEKYGHTNFECTSISPEDFQVLTSKKYDKYFVTAEGYWRNIDTIQLVKTPTQVYSNMQFSYNISKNESPSKFMFIFEKR